MRKVANRRFRHFMNQGKFDNFKLRPNQYRFLSGLDQYDVSDWTFYCSRSCVLRDIEEKRREIKRYDGQTKFTVEANYRWELMVKEDLSWIDELNSPNDVVWKNLMECRKVYYPKHEVDLLEGELSFADWKNKQLRNWSVWYYWK